MYFESIALNKMWFVVSLLSGLIAFYQLPETKMNHFFFLFYYAFKDAGHMTNHFFLFVSSQRAQIKEKVFF